MCALNTNISGVCIVCCVYHCRCCVLVLCFCGGWCCWCGVFAVVLVGFVKRCVMYGVC